MRDLQIKSRIKAKLNPALLLIFILALTTPAAAVFAPLFIVERTTNGNVVHYDAQIGANGQLDPREPVVVYWTIGSEKGSRQDLNFLERKRAWGLEVMRKSEGRYVISVVSQRQIQIEVYQREGKVHAETAIAGSRAYLRKIFVNIEGPLLLPKVNYIELFGSDVMSGEDRYERLTPPK